jgi:hypothetical protein
MIGRQSASNFTGVLIIEGESMREAGMIRFVKTAIFSGVQQLFFIRKAITSGRFSC